MTGLEATMLSLGFVMSVSPRNDTIGSVVESGIVAAASVKILYLF